MPEIRAAFEQQKDIEYSITSITGKDLDITKENDKVVIRFAYDKEVELMSPVFLLIKYEGRSQARAAAGPLQSTPWIARLDALQQRLGYRFAAARACCSAR